MAELVFELKRHENLLASLARYLSGHTEYINDFSEGSITRSLLEGVAQEMYRQNVSFGQGITSALQSAVKNAFNLPLLDSTRASGEFTAYREMLMSPESFAITFSSPSIDTSGNAASFSGYISGNVLTVSNVTGTIAIGQGISGSGVSNGTYILSQGSTNLQFIVGPSCSFVGSISGNTLIVTSVTNGQISVGHTITNGVTSYGTITALLSGTGGVGTYYISTASTIASTAMMAGAQTVGTQVSPVSMKSFSLLNSIAMTGVTASSTTTNPIPVGTYYYSVVPIFGNAANGIVREFKGSAPYSITLNSAARISVTWTPRSYFTGYRVYRSTSPFMLNASYTYIDGGSSSSLLDSSVGVTYVTNRWPGTTMTYGVSAANTTAGTRRETAASSATALPVGNTATLTWQASSSLDKLSAPIGYNVYRSDVNASIASPSNISIAPSSTSGTLNYGSQLTYAMITGNLMTVFSSSHVTLGSLAVGQQLTASTGLLSNTSIVSQLTGQTGYNGTYLVTQNHGASAITTGSGLTVNVTLSNGVIQTATINTAGSQYLNTGTGTLYFAINGGTSTAYCSVAVGTTTPGVPSGTITVIFGGAGYSATATSNVGTTVPANTVFVTNIYGTMQYYYAVATITSNGESIAAGPLPLSPSSSYRSIYLSWDSVPGAVAYRIYRDTTPSFSSPQFYDSLLSYIFDTGSIFSVATYGMPKTFLLNSSTTPSVLSFTDTGYIGTISSWPTTGQAFSLQGPINIAAGTQVRVANTSLTYSYPFSATMSAGASDVTSIIQCNSYGITGNTGANSITEFTSPVYGISGGTNKKEFINGKDVETEYEWRSRFQQVLQGASRGTFDAIVAGAIGTKIYDNNGFITDQVTKALVTEPSSLNLTVYIHNSTTSGPSASLVTETQKIIDGYVTDNGTKIPGYKAAGIPVTVTSAITVPQDIKIDVTTRPGLPVSLLRENLVSEIKKYFASLDISDGLYIPSITSVTTSSANQNISYQYRLVAIDSNGNRSAPSLVNDSLTSGNTLPNNVLTWNASSGGLSISYYDLLRWDGLQWALVQTIPVASPYIVSGSTMSYTDTSVYLSAYTFMNYSLKYFQKSELIQLLSKVPGVLSLSVTAPIAGSPNTDQQTIIPAAGQILVPGTIIVK